MSSRVFKAPYITLDKSNAVNIEVADYSHLEQRKPPEPVMEESEEADVEKSIEDIIENAKKEANKILKKAHKDAQNIENDIKTRSEEEARKAFEAAQQEGYNKGYQEGVNETAGIKKQAQQVYEDAKVQREEMLNAVEGELLKLMTGILEKLLGNAANINPNVILYLIRQGFSGATINGDVNIHISAEDYDETLKHKAEILPLVDGAVKLEILKDLSLNQGDCIIETPFGNIDCSLDRQFDSLKQDLYYILENANYENH